MHKVLIIDDEPMITKGLSEKIDWESLDCMICGTAMNGQEGKKMIDELRPDIIFSDIVMPGLTGLELANYVKENYRDSIMILLSGYDEFAFAKEAVKYSVFDYLLKPTVKEEVISVIKKGVETIEEKRKKDKNYEYLESTLQENMPIIEQSLLYDITVKGSVNSKEIRNKIESFQITFGKGAVLTIEIYEGNQKNISNERIIKSIEEILNTRNISSRFVTDNNQIIVLITFPVDMPNKILGTRIIELAETIMNYLTTTDKLCIGIGIGGIYTSIKSIHSSYLQSIKALTKSYFIGTGKIHVYEDIKQERSDNMIPNHLEAFIQHFEEWELEKILGEYNFLFKKLKYTYDKQFILNQCFELIIKLGLLVTKWDKNYKISVSYEQLDRYKSIEELQGSMKQVIINVKKHLYETMNKNNIGVVEQAKKLVEQEYDNHDLSTQYIADLLGVNVSYLSRTFKKETGKNLINYVTEKRMQIAQKLLDTTDLKTNEVAKKVGFIDARYFGQVFKKYMCATPSEYKKIK